MNDCSERQIAQLRVPPHSIEGESSVLGGLLLDNSAWDRVGDLLTDQDFYRSEHKLIYAAVGALINAAKPADVISVNAYLVNNGQADEVGGIPYLNSLAQCVLSAKNIRRYAEIVRDNAVLRGLISAGDTIASAAFNPQGKDVATILDEAGALVTGLRVTTGRTMPTSIEDSVVTLLDRVTELAEGNVPPGTPTRIPGLDRMLGGGLKGGKQIIIAARPSIGKSSLGEQLCLSLALDGHGAAFLSQEMSKDELTDRAVANLGRIALDNIISGQLTDEDWPRLTEAIERMRGIPLYLDDQPGLTLHDISAKARMLKRQHNIKLLVVDYIQLCDGGKDKDNRHHQIEELSRGTKKLARQLDITIILLSQLNREVEKRVSGRPVLSDLKESGSIEEDADVVVLLSRGQEGQGGMQLINCDVPKNRQGKVGGVTLGFDGAFQQWRESTIPFEFKKAAKRHYTEDV